LAIHLSILGSFLEIKSASIPPNTALPHALRCVVSSPFKLYLYANAFPIASTYSIDARFKSMHVVFVASAAAIVMSS
jgi:hypothetical protein